MGLLCSRPANSKVPHRTGTTVYEYQEVMQNPWHLRTLGYFRDIVHWNFFELLSRFWVNTCTENSHRGRNPVLKSWFWPHVFSLFTAISLNKQLQPLIRWLRWECRNMVWNLDLDRASPEMVVNEFVNDGCSRFESPQGWDIHTAYYYVYLYNYSYIYI